MVLWNNDVSLTTKSKIATFRNKGQSQGHNINKGNAKAHSSICLWSWTLTPTTKSKGSILSPLFITSFTFPIDWKFWTHIQPQTSSGITSFSFLASWIMLPRWPFGKKSMAITIYMEESCKLQVKVYRTQRMKIMIHVVSYCTLKILPLDTMTDSFLLSGYIMTELW